MKRYLIIDDEGQNPEELQLLLREHGYTVTETSGEAGFPLESLSWSERQYRDIIQSAPVGIFRSSFDGKFISANPATARILKYDSPEDLLETVNSKSIAEVIYVEPGRRKEILENALLSSNWRIYEKLLRCKDGSVITCNFHIRPIQGTAGNVSGLEGFIEDITDRKRAESVITARMRLLQFAETHTLDELLEATLDEAEALTGSQIGFYHFLEADQKTLSLQNWSTRTKAEFCMSEGKGLHYGVSTAGVWVDCIHERRPVIHNDYASLPHRKGLPPGHAPVARELVVPVFRGESIVAILGVGNKPRDYTAEDVEKVSLLADLAWEIAERKQAGTHIRTSLEEKDVLLKEIHHRVKNNLQIISTLLDLQSESITDEHSLEIFRDSQNRIRSMALIHEKLYQTNTFAVIDFKGYIESLADHLSRSYMTDPEKISLAIDAGTVELGIDDAIPCGLIINELVSNSLKYAFPDGRKGEILICFRTEADGCIMLEVADNGVGLPTGLDFSNTETLGLQLVTMLTRQLRGSIQVVNDQGTMFKIRFHGTDRSRK